MLKLENAKKIVVSFIELMIRERRLPSRLTENKGVQFFGFLLATLQHRLRPIPTDDVIVAQISGIQKRYIYQVLRILSLTYSQVIFVWNFSLENYVDLGQEGRRLFKIKNLKIISPASKIPKSKVTLTTHLIDNHISHEAPKIILETDVSQIPPNDSLMLPYSVHPTFLEGFEDFKHQMTQLRLHPRSLSLFFSGAVGFVTDKHLVERYYGVPSRDRSIEFLIEQSSRLNLRVISNFQERRSLVTKTEQYTNYSGVFCTCKGIVNQWLSELASANFFLALPGGYMLMCHNLIEAMAVGTIPVLSYEDWLAPTLVHGQNCLTYRTLEELPALIDAINQMDQSAIAKMRQAVIDYYDRYLSPDNIAQFLRSYQGTQLHLFINHEDAETLKNVIDTSVLQQGGTLQNQLRPLTQNLTQNRV